MELWIPIIGMITFWGGLAAIILVPRYLKSKEREALQATLRLAIEKGQSLPPEVVDAMTRDARPIPSASRDLRAGIVWLGIAAGLVGLAYAFGYSGDASEAFWPFIGFACIPGFIGVAYLIVALFNRGKGKL
jgi:hypothetical protein